MSSARVKKFTKSEGCPSSDQLLSFTLAELANERATEIISHLKVCDFCGAETHFLARFKASLSPYVPAEMPPHLRLLAESLLGKGTSQGGLKSPRFK